MYWEDISKLLKIVTGKDFPVQKLKEAGERIYNLTKKFNEREGIKEDKLPSLFFKSPLKIYDREIVVKEDFKKMLDEYYRLRGWTHQT